MYGIAVFLWGAVLGERSAAWLFQASDEQRRNAPQRKTATNNIKFNGVAPKCGSRVVALLAKGITISCVATPSGHPHLGTTIPYIKMKSALMRSFLIGRRKCQAAVPANFEFLWVLFAAVF